MWKYFNLDLFRLLFVLFLSISYWLWYWLIIFILTIRGVITLFQWCFPHFNSWSVILQVICRYWSRTSWLIRSRWGLRVLSLSLLFVLFLSLFVFFILLYPIFMKESLVQHCLNHCSIKLYFLILRTLLIFRHVNLVINGHVEPPSLMLLIIPQLMPFIKCPYVNLRFRLQSVKVYLSSTLPSCL